MQGVDCAKKIGGNTRHFELFQEGRLEQQNKINIRHYHNLLPYVLSPKIEPSTTLKLLDTP